MTEIILALLLEIAISGRVVSIPANPSDQVMPPPLIAPGPAPLVSFRYFEGKDRSRFGGLDLVLDDAGH